jgi:hypothetical protein
MKTRDLAITATVLTLPYFLASAAIWHLPEQHVQPQPAITVAHAQEAKPEPSPTPTPKPKTVQEIIKEAAIKYDVATEDLLAIATIESGYNCKSIGDGGGSYGCFQINIKDSTISGRFHKAAHPDVSAEQAMNPEWSAEWTARRLIAKGYKTNRKRAIRMHNGDPTITKTEIYYNSVNAAAMRIKEQ